MNKADELLVEDGSLRNNLHDALKAACKAYKRSAAGKSMTRLERRGMFVTHLRTELSQRAVFAHYKTYQSYSGRSYSRLRTNNSPYWNHADLVRTLISPECWYDAGILAEHKGWKETNSALVRSIMSKVWDEIASEPDSSEDSLSALDNILLSMKVCVDDAKRLNTTLENESKQVNIDLAKL